MPSTIADIWLMFTMTLTSAIGRNTVHASHAPMSVRTMSSSPRPPDRMPIRDAESSVKITMGITIIATHNKSNPNHAPASNRVATAPAPIMPAAVSAAGPTKRVKTPMSARMSAAHPPAVDHEHVTVHVIGGS